MTQLITRRGLLGMLVAPAIVRATSIMPIYKLKFLRYKSTIVHDGISTITDPGLSIAEINKILEEVWDKNKIQSIRYFGSQE